MLLPWHMSMLTKLWALQQGIKGLALEERHCKHIVDMIPSASDKKNKWYSTTNNSILFIPYLVAKPLANGHNWFRTTLDKYEIQPKLQNAIKDNSHPSHWHKL